MKNAVETKTVWISDKVGIKNNKIIIATKREKPSFDLKDVISLSIYFDKEDQTVFGLRAFRDIIAALSIADQKRILGDNWINLDKTENVEILKWAKDWFVQHNYNIVIEETCEFWNKILVTLVERDNARGVYRIDIVNDNISNTKNDKSANDIVPLNDTFYLQDNFKLAFNLASHTLKNSGYLNVYITGPSGYGKTSFFEYIANKNNVPIFHMNCATVLDPEKWFGRMQVSDGTTYFETTPFTEAIRSGNCVILLDEINRVSPEVSNSLLPILDHRRETVIGTEKITCGKGIIFGMTANIGFQYTGTNQLDTALKNRNLIRLNVNAMPLEIEKSLLKNIYSNLPDDIVHFIVDICNAIRNILTDEEEKGNFVDIDVSTRTAKAMAEIAQMSINAKIDIDKATILDYTVFNNMEPRTGVMIIDRLKIEGLI